MKTLKLALPAAILMAGFMAFTSASYGTPAYAKKEAAVVGEGMKACPYCHVAAGKKDLNDTGKCYQTNGHKDLAKCAPEKK
jgi:cytochrome c553